jgi:hypothetical protein
MPLEVDKIIRRLESSRLQKLRRIMGLLWLAGNHRRTIRPLHRHKMLGREIIVSEDISLHLVTQDGKVVFIKPFPRDLLTDSGLNVPVDQPRPSARSPSHPPNPQLQTQIIQLVNLDDVVEEQANIIRGFIWTYISMIQSVTDFRIAVENHLLPAKISHELGIEEAFDNWHRSVEAWRQQIGLALSYYPRYRLNYIQVKELGSKQKMSNSEIASTGASYDLTA